MSLFFAFTCIHSVYAALSATTANSIQGTAPYIELNGLQVTNLSSLLSIKIGSDVYVSDSSGNMQKRDSDGTLTSITSLTLANAGDQFDSVSTLVPADTTSYRLNDTSIIPLTARKDDDGDADFTVSGNIQGEWKDKNGTSVGSDLTNVPSNCLAPYTLTLTSTNSPSITTQYGDPNETTYPNSTAVFTINPVSKPEICFAKPDMSYATGNYAGPTTMWDTTNGFIPQSTDEASYGSNFPTTGANRIYFDLLIEGATSALTWPSVTVGNITATMSNITDSSVRVTLTGPAATSILKGATVASPTVLPATFELSGNDSAGSAIVKYGFVIKKWFVNRQDSVEPYADQLAWCNGLDGSNYVGPKVADLTNASGTAGNLGGKIYGATPSSGVNFYRRIIGAGFFSEWGNLKTMSGAQFTSLGYATTDFYNNYTYAVTQFNGTVTTWTSTKAFGLCTQP